MARVTVLLPASLVALFAGSDRKVSLDAEDVAGVIAELHGRWPGMGDRLVDSRPAIRQHISIYVNAERAGLDTLLCEGDEVLVATAISGG